jgi:hypothetical protein
VKATQSLRKLSVQVQGISKTNIRQNGVFHFSLIGEFIFTRPKDEEKEQSPIIVVDCAPYSIKYD